MEPNPAAVSPPGLSDQGEEKQYPQRLKKARGKRTDRDDRTDLPPR